MSKMVRMQVQLTHEQQERLKALAAERSVSLAALVREGIERTLAEEERKAKWRRAWEVVGCAHDEAGATDLSVNHDEYLAEIYADDKQDLR
jgi:hypothetical protein